VAADLPIERIAGERFTSVEPTPLLAKRIGRTRDVLARALEGRAVVEVASGWEFGPDTELVPSIVVTSAGPQNGGPRLPDLVVEFRTESTGRYILGPKRVVYSRYRVPEFWYVDPRGRRVAVLRSEEGAEYGWPPRVYGEDDVIEVARFPGARVDARSLLGPPPPVASSTQDADVEAWLGS
jgi:Uma2 family endonuclease